MITKQQGGPIRKTRYASTCLLLLALLVLLGSQAIAAQAAFADPAFQRVWERSDRPVAEGQAPARGPGGRSRSTRAPSRTKKRPAASATNSPR